MLPRLATVSTSQAPYLAFIGALRAAGFAGDISPDYASRVVMATDNSIYQLLPQGVVYPRNTADLVRIARLGAQPRFRDIVLTARGGGTGTNGQSLSDGLVVDLSRHMNRILEINVEQRWARVEAGVVKDQLNAALAPHGLFFAPELSTSNRATIGGMINTDASGQGSCVYGKTRDHVLGLRSVFLDGCVWDSAPIDATALGRAKRRNDRIGEIHRVLDAVVDANTDAIERRFPKLNRCLTGYDLAHVRRASGEFDLNAVLCGAEGTLALVAEARLNLLPVPACSALVNVKYASFDATLRDAQALIACAPTSIEAIDSRVLELAMNDVVWDTVADLFPREDGTPLRGVNLVEFSADTEAELKHKVDTLVQQLAAVMGQDGRNTGYSVAYGADQLRRIGAMRKKAVGLLGNVAGDRRPIPFVEDTAVPPQNLADYIHEFRAVLDRHGLAYGMFGHVDAGVLHVRPAVDMKDPAQALLIRTISDEVVALTHKYKGLLWGEHGKGMRSEYAPELFGDLYPCLQQIKAACDPHNQLNPGKICTPAGSGVELLRIDGVPTRGEHDRQVPPPVRSEYAAALNCNGNGACYNYDPDDAMCPSWKGTRQRAHSPKGRAALMREWLRLLAARGFDPLAAVTKARRKSFVRTLLPRLRNTLAQRRGEYDFSTEVHAAMSGCLACKSCSTQCPVRVDVAAFRSRFLELYYARYLRPLRHYLIGTLEFTLPHLARFPQLCNHILGNPAIAALLRRGVGLTDTPALSRTRLPTAMAKLGITLATPAAIARLAPGQRQRSVILVQDAFTSHYEADLVVDLLELLRALGFHPLVAPFRANGKPLHVHGLLRAFHATASANALMLRALQDTGVPLIGLEPSMTLSYASEYVASIGTARSPRVLLVQDWLATQTARIESCRPRRQKREFLLLPHCTERSTAPASMHSWQSVFEAFGQSLQIADLGCCGMAGTYGHETANLEISQRIYDLSWAPLVADPTRRERALATGYSCRSQVRRFGALRLRHPVQLLLQLLRERSLDSPSAAPATAWAAE